MFYSLDSGIPILSVDIITMKKLLTALVFIITSMFASAEPIRVVLLNPGGSHWFWKMMINHMQAAAEDLDMQLEVITSNWEHYLTVRQAKEVVNRKNPPDYIITGNEKSNAGNIIKLADGAGVKVFLFSNGFVYAKDVEAYGRPRGKYKYWIGEMIPNNFSAGYQMGKVLIDQALSANLIAQDGKVHIGAIAGTYATHASVERIRGLKAVVEEYADKVELLQVIPGDWTAQRGEKAAMGLFRRYPEIGVIWGANDTTALGAMRAAVSIGKTPGKDVLFGGCCWYAPAIQKILSGELSTSAGGHFMEAGWTMVLLYDYHHGIDFIAESIETFMYSIDSSNVEEYSKAFAKHEWNKIDFRKFSKVHNPSLRKYDFSLNVVLQQLEEITGEQ